MRHIKTLFTVSTGIVSSTALAHHGDPQQGILGSILHWMSQPDHLLLMIVIAALAFTGQKIFSKN